MKSNTISNTISCVMDYSVGEVELSYRPLNKSKGKVLSSETAYKIIRPTFPNDKIQYKEYFKAMFLNHANEVIGYSTISEGGVDVCSVDLRLIFQAALLTNCTGIILVHNHPSGLLKPSPQDRKLTQQVEEAGKILHIRVLDHLIIGDESYYSFSDEGLI